jgi:DNA-binding MarR family transcriptional regulator
MDGPPPPAPAAGDALTELIDEVFKSNGAFLAEGDALLAPLGLTGRQWQVLGFLADGPATVSDLARRRGLRRQSVQEVVERLVKEDFVGKRPNPRDRRAPLLQLSETGRGALATIEPLRAHWADRRAAAVSATDIQVTITTLRRLRESTAELPPRATPGGVP